MEFWLHVIVETRVRRAILTWARVEEFRVLFARAREQDELGVDEGHRPVVDARIISLARHVEVVYSHFRAPLAPRSA